MADQYLSDQPITRRTQDRFSRAPFATRIAETISKRIDPASIVIGLFGPWGDGKTSVLEMMEEALCTNSNVIVIRFNPWHFQSEEMLLRGFFATLADGLGRSLPSLKERAGEMLKKYGALLSLGSLTFGGIVQIQAGDAAKGLGEALSTVGLDELKKRIDDLLSESGKRLVVFIDDIDRLDRDETHSVFKLVKLSASFTNTCYVLAFDDEVVSAALGQRYGAGGQEAGRAFLEKIIQVPLHLPPADNISLRTLAFEGIESALNQTGIALDQSKTDAFVTHFIDGLEPQLQTPRRCKLYTNALTFALPLLKDEVDTVDLMLIEGIRVFYPRLYAGVRDNPELFLKGNDDRRLRGAELQPSRVDALLEQSLLGTTQAQREKIKDRLLKPLFPRIGAMGYGHEWDAIWTKGKRVCSAHYFRRFFSYGIPEGDISDSQVNAWVASLHGASPETQREQFKAFSARRAMPRLISMLREQADSISQDDAVALATTICQNAELFPRERGPMVVGGTSMQAGILVSQLLRRVEPDERRQQVTNNIIGNAEPISFAMECWRWARYSPDRAAEKAVLAEGKDGPLISNLARRIAELDATSPLYLRYPKDTPALYWLWKKAGRDEEIRISMERRFAEYPAEVDNFIDAFVGEGWEIESGLPVRSSLDRENYDSITGLIPAEFIVENLKRRFGTELDEPQYHPDRSFSSSRKFAHQFVYIHNGLAGDLPI
ncbi:MAG: P-loop NTPase fold protein [Pseudomonadota bacterium]